MTTIILLLTALLIGHGLGVRTARKVIAEYRKQSNEIGDSATAKVLARILYKLGGRP